MVVRRHVVYCDASPFRQGPVSNKALMLRRCVVLGIAVGGGGGTGRAAVPWGHRNGPRATPRHVHEALHVLIGVSHLPDPELSDGAVEWVCSVVGSTEADSADSPFAGHTAEG